MNIAHLGWKYYLIYVIINMCFVPIVHFSYVETARLSLGEIDRIFEIKYERGSSITYGETTRRARVWRSTDGEKTGTDIEVDQGEIADAAK